MSQIQLIQPTWLIQATLIHTITHIHNKQQILTFIHTVT